jgi:hypothetical protein
MAEIPFFPFPFHPEEEDEKSLQTFKWKTEGQDYTMYAMVLNDTNVQVLVPHCVETRAKIMRAVPSAILASSLYSQFPRTLSTSLVRMWDQVTREVAVEQQTTATFDKNVKEFIASYLTEADHHDLVQQLHKAIKPREVSVQDFWRRLEELNGYIEWLPLSMEATDDDDRPLGPAQLKKTMYDAMPKVWRNNVSSMPEWPFLR